MPQRRRDSVVLDFGGFVVLFLLISPVTGTVRFVAAIKGAVAYTGAKKNVKNNLSAECEIFDF